MLEFEMNERWRFGTYADDGGDDGLDDSCNGGDDGVDAASDG